MDLSAFTADAWQAASLAEKTKRARALARALPRGFAFLAVEPQDSFGRRWDAALFALGDHRFALVPGGPAIHLGYQPERHPLALTDDDRESYEWSQESFDLPPLDEYLDTVLTPARTVALAPYLYDVVQTHAELARMLRQAGLRLPSSDEWEHALSGGAESVFLWGDTIGRRLDDPTRWCNAFGILGPSGYPELTDDPFTLRGADTGPLECAGVGRVVMRLAASPRRHEPRCTAKKLSHDTYELRLRRVCPLA